MAMSDSKQQNSTLLQKIMDANFQNETRSLFSNNKGSNQHQRESSKKRRIMGLDFSSNDKQYEKMKYNLDLETVHENEVTK